MIETRSDQFRVQVLAETLKDIDKDRKFNPKTGDKIVDRSNLTDDNPETQSFTFLK
jgi:hypothetical protein